METQQTIYNQFVENTPVRTQEGYCGYPPRGNELYFIQKYGEKNILDIGCGTGHRTFPEYIKRNWNFFGIEKFQNLIDASRYKQSIIQGDICSSDFSNTLQNDKLNAAIGYHYDITLLLGGIINAFVDSNYREKGWANIQSLSNKSNYILVDTLTHFNWFNENKTGQIEQIHPLLPPQYFYSKKEIATLITSNNLQLFEEKSENLPMTGLIRNHYLLKKKN